MSYVRTGRLIPRKNHLHLYMVMKAFPSARLFFLKGRLFHNFIVLLDLMELVPAWLMMGLFGTALLGVVMIWPGWQGWAFAIPASCLSAEAYLLFRSRRLGVSPSPFGGPFFLFGLTHVLASVVPPLLPLSLPWMLGLHVMVQLVLLGCMVYGSIIEPFRVDLREESVELGHGGEIRVLVLSDLHIDRAGKRESRVLELARVFGPDLVLWPGDLTNLSYVHDRVTAEQCREVVRELCRLAPVYVSRGTPEVDDRAWVKSILNNTPAVLLDNSGMAARVRGHELFFMGIPCEGKLRRRGESLARLMQGADGSPSVLLHHSPDMVDEAAEAGVSLYVAGHTHGGQIRLPFFGPMYTASRYGRKYFHGKYKLGDTHMVVSSGIGMEGGGAPRIRFLCRPEVVGIRLRLP